MKAKKLLAALLAVTAALTLTACGGRGRTQDKTDETKTADSSVAESSSAEESAAASEEDIVTSEETHVYRDYKTAYKERLLYLSSEPLTSGELMFSVDYALADLDSNGVPELIVKTGTCEADYLVDVYTYEDEEVFTVGEDLPGDHSVFMTDKSTGDFVIGHGITGSGRAEKYSLKDYSLETTDTTEFEYGDGDDFDKKLAEFGDFEKLETCYNFYSDGTWTTSFSDGTSTEGSGVDVSLVDNS
jgi:hypothetical protein